MSKDRIRDIVASYCQRLPGQLRDLDTALGGLAGIGAIDVAALSAAQIEAHRLSGSAHCMGFADLGDALGLLERQLSDAAHADSGRARAQLKQVDACMGLILRALPSVIPENSVLFGLEEKDEDLPVFDDAAAETLAALRRSDIIVADDDVSIRRLVRTILVSSGYRNVHLAGSGRNVLELGKTVRPSLILSDWNMQPLDGLELLHRVRAGQTAFRKNTPFVFLTRENELEKVRTAARAGVDHFLVKPFTPEDLMRAVSNVLERDAAAREAS